MKRVILTIVMFITYAFGFNYSGTWINKSDISYNDPIKLKIENRSIRPIIKRGDKIVALKKKETTIVGNELYEAWGFGSKNLVLLIKPITKNKIRVIEKKIYTNKKVIYTKSFLFVRKEPIINIKKRYLGNYRSSSSFSAISRISIKEIDGELFVRGWKKGRYKDRPLGIAKAKLYNNKLHITWRKKDLIVSATIKGYNYNPNNNKFRNLQLDIKERDINSELTNRQTIQLKRGLVKFPPRVVTQSPQSIYKKFKIGPVDVNLMINSY